MLSNQMNPVVLIPLIICLGVAVVGIFRPFLGLMVLMVIHFAQPAELVPVLAPFRIELVYAVLLLAAFTFHRLSTSSTPLLSDRILVAALIFLASAVLSVPFAIWRGGALDSTLELAKLIALLFLITGLIDNNKKLNSLLWLQVVLLVWFAGSGLYAFLHGQFYALGNLERAEGVNSLAGGPNQLAGVLLSLLPFAAALFRCNRRIVVRFLLIACLIFAVAVMVFTGSRIAILGLATLAIYYVATSRHKFFNFALSLVLASIIWVSMPSIYQQRYLTLMNYASGGKLDDSNAYRLQIWQAGWKIFIDHPMLGVGTGQFSTAFGLIYSGKEHGAWMNPHNLLIQVTCELGLVGLVTFLYFITQIVRAIRDVLRTKSNAPLDLNYEIAIACNVMFVATIIISLVSHSLYRPYWYLLAGFAAANRVAVLNSQTDQVLDLPDTTQDAENNLDPVPQPWPTE